MYLRAVLYTMVGWPESMALAYFRLFHCFENITCPVSLHFSLHAQTPTPLWKPLNFVLTSQFKQSEVDLDSQSKQPFQIELFPPSLNMIFICVSESLPCGQVSVEPI